MSKFAEEVLKEYKPLIKRKTPTKDVLYKIRVLKRTLNGLFVKLVDIREYIITQKRFGFTESGIYLDKKELDYIIDCLIDARKEFFKDGRDTGTRNQNTIGNKA